MQPLGVIRVGIMIRGSMLHFPQQKLKQNFKHRIVTKLKQITNLIKATFVLPDANFRM